MAIPAADQLLRSLWVSGEKAFQNATEIYESSLAQPPTPQNFAAGAFADNQATSTIDSFNPQTGRSYLRVPNSSPSEVDCAVLAAHEAFQTWSKTSKSARSKLLNRVADLIAGRRDAFAAWESIDQGKTFARAKVEIDRAVSNFRYFAGYILHDEAAARFTDDDILCYEHRSPLGVFALISPWNMPLYLLTWKIAPCLAFGATCVAKPSELTSMTAFLLADVFRMAGIPNGVVNIVFGAGLPTGSALVQHKLVRGVSFTGGTATGLKIRKSPLTTLGSIYHLNLGTAAAAALENQGEICLCGSRIYVENSIYNDFIARYTSHVSETYRVKERVGAVVSLGHYNKIRGYLELAQQEGADFKLGTVPTSDPPEGYWIEPTILTGLQTSSTVLRDEMFGPVVTVSPFGDEDEAVRLANDNPNGLAAVVLTRDGARMRRVGEQLEAGMVWINCWLVRQLATPPGTGREGGAYSRDVFTVGRTLHIPMQ
ncbi:Putative aldehyde dehydrogenase domain, aldehyde/histidinol dehydrogenase [Septoria linicola]|uniref:Aldehyde dehydrogenase domain, aldehyde/histidinol dehydrogenase n=1 Tax=Septoria linicola TaxID=215465 RepID=A0A9Q9AYU4_9PEZI|nr:putative aldehyde dehydrogenase domain, aldehyde/histidinol dehydrogenase [Septoria linicola]USW53156.1 Putative aldehyde dehydrogenase domain, aldehyde/histidinol dehydrogenase [Septoria linicola]